MTLENLSYDELDQHVVEQLILGDDSISVILKGHILIENILEILISRNIKKPSYFFKKQRSFELKLDLAYSMELINNNYFKAFKSINSIRNNYAHRHNYNVTLNELNSFKFEWEDIQNKAYEKAKEQGINEAIRIATLFLLWKTISLTH